MSKVANEKTKSHKGRKILLGILLLILVFFLVAAATVFIMESKGKKQALQETVSEEEITAVEDAQVEDDGKTVVYQGKTYHYNEDISTILFMGVDREAYNESDEVYGEGGQSDTIIVLAVNNKTGHINMIPVSRNSMVDVDTYSPDGQYGGQKKMQITLAYAYGDGREKSCENVAKAVSRLMHGIPVNDYVAIDLSAIGTLNDAIGGVTVTIPEDLTDADPAFEQGKEITLKGEQAVTFVRTRKSVKEDESVDNNDARMDRQKQYISQYMAQAVSHMKKDPGVALSLYSAVSDNMISTFTTSEILYYATMAGRKGVGMETSHISGQVKSGEYTEVYVDEKELYELILDTFYYVQD